MKILLSTSASHVPGVSAAEYLRLLKEKRAVYDRQATDAQRTGDHDDAEDFRRESGAVAQLMDKITKAETALASAQHAMSLLLDQAAEYVTPVRR